jgi:hypothetical protein
MKIILTFIFIIGTVHSFAGEFLIYNMPKDKVLLSYQYQDVFTEREKSFLKSSSASKEIYEAKKTIVSSDKEFKEYIAVNCSQCRVERLGYGSLQSSYKGFQWALKNTGKSQTRWTSDIDSYSIQGKLGEDINIDEQENKNNNILVAIIDSGIDTNHPDLKNKIYTHPKECEALADYNLCINTQSDRNICHTKYKDFDANGNGYPLDCHGWSITDKSNPLNDLEGNGNINDLVGHGTHIAGIIGAEKNEFGINGVISNVTLLPIQVSVSSKNNSKTIAADKFAKALLYAIKSNAQIVNMSLGWRFDQDSALMREMIKLAQSKGILIVVAAGNDSHQSESYPCSYDEVICVGSHDIDGNISSFSNFGSHIDLLAPGSNILSTWPTNKRSRGFTLDEDYEYQSGTSQATPYVTGVLARLLNQGFTPEQARKNLLNGTRDKKHSRMNQVRFGNLDYKQALLTKEKSLFIPFSKSASLINWDKDKKSFKLKVKNLSSSESILKLHISPYLNKTQTNFKFLSSTKLSKKFDQGQVQEFSFSFSSDYNVEGNFLFKLSLNDKVYIIQAKALSLINSDNTRDDLSSFDLVDSENFTQGAILREFSNSTNDNIKEFLALKEIDGSVHIARVHMKEDKYVVSPSLRLPFKESIIINLSKVDLDLDGENDYVLTLVNLTDRENRETKFLALDKSFKPKRIEIAPKNTFKNDITVLPGSFIWLKYQNRMVPSWITIGERPLDEREVQSPWSRVPVEIKKKTMYLQLPKGLKTVSFKGKDELPLHFLYQRSTKSKGEAILISSIGFGFNKKYNIYKFSEKLVDLGELSLTTHFDIASAKPLPLVGSKGEHVFFNTPSINGAQNILSMDFDVNSESMTTSQFKAHSTDRAPIKFVLSVKDQTVMSQTSNRILFEDDDIQQTVSNTDSRRIKHSLLRSKQALFLSTNLTPGIGSEVIQVHQKTHTLYRPAAFQMFGTKGCTEVGFVFEEGHDQIIFNCPESKKLIKIKL